jgi:mannose-1-phosphate guanylyltransferase
MKAFLMAAGLGTRLRPLTNDIPKCLIPVNGKPMLSYWIELMEKHGVTEVLISIHHLADKVVDFIKAYESRSVTFKFFEEVELLGSGGSLRENKDFVSKEQDFFIFYADNLTNINLTDLLAFHRLKNQPFTMALNRVENPYRCGIAELDENSIVKSFVEKPKTPASNLANAGVYVAKPEVLDLLPTKKIVDIGYDLLPQLIGQMAGWETTDYLIDIGTLESLDRAEREWRLID